SIDKLNLLPEQEQQLLDQWNDTYSKFEDDKCLHQLFEEVAAKNPQAIALKFKDKSISYDELNDNANRIAHLLLSKGLKTGDLVGLSVERSAEMVTAMLGIVKAGGVYVPVDPEFPAERITYMLENSAARFIITEKNIADKFNFKCEHQ